MSPNMHNSIPIQRIVKRIYTQQSVQYLLSRSKSVITCGIVNGGPSHRCRTGTNRSLNERRSKHRKPIVVRWKNTPTMLIVRAEAGLGEGISEEGIRMFQNKLDWHFFLQEKNERRKNWMMHSEP